MIFYNLRAWLAVDDEIFSYLIILFSSGESEAFTKLQGMFEINCLLVSISISTWGTIKNNIYLSFLLNTYTAVYKCTC